jgi:hypothetical protein
MASKNEEQIPKLKVPLNKLEKISLGITYCLITGGFIMGDILGNKYESINYFVGCPLIGTLTAMMVFGIFLKSHGKRYKEYQLSNQGNY